MLRLALLTALFNSATALCPSGFELVRNGECYKQLADAQNMNAANGPSYAKSECANFLAEPVIIRNKEDNDYWMSVAVSDHKKGGNNGFILLGLECSKEQGYWRWTDGSQIDFKPEDYPPDLIEPCDNHQDAWAEKCMWTMNPVTKNWQEWCNIYQMVDLYCVVEADPNPAEPDRDCGSFSPDDDDDICYQVGLTASNWTEANWICRSFGANVASIHSDTENSFVRRLAVSKGLVNGLMLGGTGTTKKNFKWTDGSDWDYDNFANGFPISGSGECLAMQTNNKNGQWVNIDCSTDLPFACVRQTDAQVPMCDGGILHKEGDVLYSPGFPTSSSEPCDFMLKVDAGLLVEVEILYLEANECCDHLVLFEGTLGGQQIASLSGELQNGRTFRTTSQNVMRASWQPNGGVNVKGMMITFRSVPKS